MVKKLELFFYEKTDVSPFYTPTKRSNAQHLVEY